MEYLVFINIPLFFVGMWLGITGLLGFLSGWQALAQRYPNRADTPLKSLSGRSGRMGALGTGYNHVLTFGVCRSGLRVEVFWLFAAFNKPFFVPWDQIQTENIDGIFYDETRLTFGRPQHGTLIVARSLADEIAASAPKGTWPA